MRSEIEKWDKLFKKEENKIIICPTNRERKLRGVPLTIDDIREAMKELEYPGEFIK